MSEVKENFIDELSEFLQKFPDFFKLRLEGVKINITIEKDEGKETDDSEE